MTILRGGGGFTLFPYYDLGGVDRPSIIHAARLFSLSR